MRAGGVEPDSAGRTARRLVGLIAAVLVASPASALPPATSEDEACQACHEVALGPNPHATFGCTSCHTDVVLPAHPGETGPPRVPDEACTACHDARHPLGESVHAGLACADCHGPAHEMRPASDLHSRTSPVGQITTCGGCHGEPPTLVEGYVRGVHAAALLRSGLVVAPSCNDCHGAHDVFPSSNPRSSTAPQNVPLTCGTCHGLLVETWIADSTHGRAWEAGSREVPTCVDCHSSHAIEDPTADGSRFRSPELCGGCHGEPYATYRDGFHGKVTDLGLVTAAVCSDCHTPHRALPARDAASSVHVSNVAATCGGCHGEVSTAFASYDPHADPRSPTGHPWVHRTWLLMTGLLLAVFGFFAVHDLLWLQRSAVGALRGEFRASHSGAGPYVKRFSRQDVWLHAIVVVSFLVLAATGLPLKFHPTGWARQAVEVLGGVGTASVLHRLAALATLAYAFFHLGDLFRRILIRGERELLWGWRSLVPQPRDVIDLARHLRYFLYLGPRPAFDRWTYWEKFDYFAVFWGVLIIGASGLMLWFPHLATDFLPGWTLNAAFVVHGDEALLAVGFIFLFHFFHTHLRPESFPLDPVIFLGRMPLERFKAERPMEYQRLVTGGELEDRLIAPPTPRQVRVARIFGFGAVFVGLVLVVALLASVMQSGVPT